MNNLQMYRNKKKELKLTNEKISALSGIPKRTVEDFFRGATPNPKIDTVEAIEKALGISSRLEWTDEERALGVGNHPTFLSDIEREWLELGSEVLRIRGEDYYKVLKKMIEAAIKME